jgi:26S proteasome regulatory subunit T4
MPRCLAGMFAIRGERDYVVEEDFMRAARKIAETKKLESKLDYGKI